MSWDISVQDMPDVARIEDIPDDFRPEPLGQRADVIASIQTLVPEVDFSDPSWGRLEDERFSIEFNMGSKERCEGFMLHVRGGDTAIGVIDHILKGLGRRAFDCSAGDFFSADSGQESFSAWRAFRDRVVSESDAT